MDRFFQPRNVERYRALASTQEEAQRKLTLKLLAEENARLKQDMREQVTLAQKSRDIQQTDPG
jgi:hypothetical protein